MNINIYLSFIFLHYTKDICEAVKIEENSVKSFFLYFLYCGYTLDTSSHNLCFRAKCIIRKINLPLYTPVLLFKMGLSGYTIHGHCHDILMEKKCFLIFLFQASAAHVDPVFSKFEPAVCFICNKPAMHRVVNGWEPDYDRNMTCLEDPDDILNYCKKVRKTLVIFFCHFQH